MTSPATDAERTIGALMAERTLKAGATLIHERSACTNLYLLQEGWAFRYTTTRSGMRQIPLVLLPGDFCNLDIMAFERCGYGVRMASSGKVMSAPRTAVARAVTDSGTLNSFFLKRLAIENAMLARSALCLGRKSAEARVAHLLCELATRLNGGVLEHSSQFEMPLTQEQLGDVLGLTMVHINRIFRRLAMSGIIERRGHVVDIPDVARLSQIAEFDSSYLHSPSPKDEGESVANVLGPLAAAAQ